MVNEELQVKITELTWPLNEGDLGVLWQIPSLPTDFFERLREPHPTDAKRFLVKAQHAPHSNLVDPRTVAATVCTTPVSAGYARVWPPFIPDDVSKAHESKAAEAVLGAVADFSGAPVMAVVDAANTVARDQFENAGFSQACKVLHLADVGDGNQVAQRTERTSRDANPISFRPVAEEQAEHFFALVERTYEQTDDCPSLSVQQSIAEVRLRWERTLPSEREKYWFTVFIDEASGNHDAGDEASGDDDTSRENPNEIGCLVLDLPAQSKNAELVYMGLLPDHRRKGYGQQLADFAKRIRRTEERPTLTLSVDSGNESALRCYMASGFAHYAESHVFLSTKLS